MKRYIPLLLLSPAFVWAQSAPSTPPAPPDAPPGTSATGPQYDTPMDQLRDKLKLRAEQQPYWNAFQNRIDAYVGLYLRQKPPQAFVTELAPRQIGLLVDQLQNRLTALEDIELTFKELYVRLDTTQQTTANQLVMSAIPTFVSGARPSESSSPEGRGARGGRGNGGPPGGGMGGGMGGGGMGGGMGGGF